MIIGTLMALETCLILGQVSHNLLYSTKKLLTDICGLGGYQQENSLHPGQIIFDQNSGNQWESTPSWRRSKSGLRKKLHFENARTLRGIYFIDPEDTEFKETIKNARKKLETSVAPAMPCKIMKNCGSGGSNKIKTKLACILEAYESRMRMGNSIPHNHEDHIAKKVKIHYRTTNWFTNLFQCLKHWKFLQGKQRWTRNWKNWRKFLRGIWRKSEVRKRWSMKQGCRALQFILHH